MNVCWRRFGAGQRAPLPPPLAPNARCPDAKCFAPLIELFFGDFAQASPGQPQFCLPVIGSNFGIGLPVIGSNFGGGARGLPVIGSNFGAAAGGA